MRRINLFKYCDITLQSCFFYKVAVCLVLIGNSLLLAACVSLKYQEPQNVKRIDEQVNQASQVNKHVSHVTIAMILKEIESPEIKVTRDLPKHPIRFGFSGIDQMDGKSVYTSIFADIGDKGTCKILYQGMFGPAATNAFKNAAEVIRSYPCRETLVKLSSSGGYMLDGIRVGLMIRQNQWSTLAWKYNDKNDKACVSSCAFAFLGGKNRYAHSNDFIDSTDAGRLYFHQVSTLEDGVWRCVENPQDLQTLIVYEYFKEVLPEASALMLGKMLNEPCYSANTTVTSGEDLDKIVKTSGYTAEIYNKFK